MSKLLSLLDGCKSYIVALAAIIYAITQFWQGACTQQQLIAAILAALGYGTMRSAMKTEVKRALMK